MTFLVWLFKLIFLMSQLDAYTDGDLSESRLISLNNKKSVWVFV